MSTASEIKLLEAREAVLGALPAQLIKDTAELWGQEKTKQVLSALSQLWRAQSDTPRDELRENLADYAHRAWSGWMEYLFSKCDGQTIPDWAWERWKRQAQTAYVDLSEDEKNSDRVEADKIIAILVGRKEPSVQKVGGVRVEG